MFDFPSAKSTIAPMDAAETPAAIEFGRFAVLPHRRELLAEGRPVELGGRAFDVLMALIEASGVVVSKDMLMERVWPNRIVEENSLQAQISALRRALGADRDLIRTIAGRGYQFAGEIRAQRAHRFADRCEVGGLGHGRTAARPLLTAMPSRSTTRERKLTTSPSRHISVRSVSPGKTGAEKRQANETSFWGS